MECPTYTWRQDRLVSHIGLSLFAENGGLVTFFIVIKRRETKGNTNAEGKSLPEIGTS